MKFQLNFKVIIIICFFYYFSSIAQQESLNEELIKSEGQSNQVDETYNQELNYKDYIGNSPGGESATDGEEASKALDIRTFATDPNQLGALANSVNLFTGQVFLPINLISMSGRNRLDVNVSISYSSNVKNNVDTWNLESPTGVLGLGWSLGFSQIVVDHKQTGTREDDDFYLIDGRISNHLISLSTDKNLILTKRFRKLKKITQNLE